MNILRPKSLLLICVLALFLIVPVRARLAEALAKRAGFISGKAGAAERQFDGVKNSPTASPLPVIDVGAKIQEGISLLKSSPPLIYETKNKKPAGDLVRKQIALAILDKTTGEIFEKRVWVREQEVKDYKKTGMMTFEPVALGETLDIQPKWWNSFNTFYEIKNRPDLIVVANKYLFPSSYIVGLPEKSKNKYTDIVYAPYSTSIHLPEIIAAGKRYIDENVNLAFGQLNLAGVVSRSSRGKLVTAVIGKEFVKNIVLIEHIDPDSFSTAADGGRELTERVLAIIGANQDHAYRYTGSPAGASGLAQFIKSTYKTIVSKYPDAHLIKDYNLGMADHANAIKAMVLFFDNYKNDIDDKVTRRDVIGQIGITEEMLAAAYNGGPNKVVKSVNKYGLAWINSQFVLPRAKAVFKPETLNYIQKFRSIKDLDIF